MKHIVGFLLAAGVGVVAGVVVWGWCACKQFERWECAYDSEDVIG